MTIRTVLQRVSALLLAGVIVCFTLPTTVAAQTDAAIAQGFTTSDTVVRGTLVSVVPTANRTVKIATPQDIDRLIGVVVNDPLVAIDSSDTAVQVVTNGVAYALVSDINGSIKRGDGVTLSAIDGVGARATVASQIVGIANDDFTNAVAVKEHTIKDNTGKSHTVKVGLLQVNVGPMYFQPPTSPAASLVPGFLQNVANSVAGHQVVSVRIYIAAGVFLAGLIAIGMLFYSSIRYSITAIGRNPLSAPAVHRGLTEVGIISSVTFVIILLVVYLILVI